MKTYVVSRRQLLRGAGGLSVGLPFLASLHPRRADGADPVPGVRKRFAAIFTGHGGITYPNMFPADSALTTSMTLFPGYDIKQGPLKASQNGSDAVVSPVLTGSANVMTARLLGKLNVLRGFDIPFYIGHHGGGHLGNFADNLSTVGDIGTTLKPAPTIDQVMAWSPSFYPSLDGIKMRSVFAGEDGGPIRFSWGWSNPQTKSGNVQEATRFESVGSLFDMLVGSKPSGPSPTPAATRKPVVDLVLQSYKSLRDGNRRLSAEDKQRLDAWMGHLSELERGAMAATKTCGSFTSPGNPKSAGAVFADPAGAKAYFTAMNSLIAAAFACDVTRVFTYNVHAAFHVNGGDSDWHQNYAHLHFQPEKQAAMQDALKNAFQGTFLDLAAKLDAIDDGGGRTVLDNTLVAWSQESGPGTHDPYEITVCTAGAAGGFFKTGMYVDYTDRRTKASSFARTGLPYRRWLANALQAVGVPRTEFEQGGAQGYGDAWVNPGFRSKVMEQKVFDNQSAPLPFIT